MTFLVSMLLLVVVVLFVEGPQGLPDVQLVNDVVLFVTKNTLIVAIGVLVLGSLWLFSYAAMLTRQT